MMQTRTLIVDDETPEVLEAVEDERSPAMDYLLKPFCRERFQESLQRVRQGDIGRWVHARLQSAWRPSWNLNVKSRRLLCPIPLDLMSSKFH